MLHTDQHSEEAHRSHRAQEVHQSAQKRQRAISQLHAPGRLQALLGLLTGTVQQRCAKSADGLAVCRARNVSRGAQIIALGASQGDIRRKSCCALMSVASKHNVKGQGLCEAVALMVAAHCCTAIACCASLKAAAYVMQSAVERQCQRLPWPSPLVVAP